MVRQRDYSAELTGLADLREGPGILILTLRGQLQYMNRRSWDFLRLINESACIRSSGSLLPLAVTDICRQIRQLRRPESTIAEWEHIEIRHIVGVPEQPVLLRGVGLPASPGAAPPRITPRSGSNSPSRNTAWCNGLPRGGRIKKSQPN